MKTCVCVCVWCVCVPYPESLAAIWACYLTALAFVSPVVGRVHLEVSPAGWRTRPAPPAWRGGPHLGADPPAGSPADSPAAGTPALPDPRADPSAHYDTAGDPRDERERQETGRKRGETVEGEIKVNEERQRGDGVRKIGEQAGERVTLRVMETVSLRPKQNRETM